MRVSGYPSAPFTHLRWIPISAGYPSPPGTHLAWVPICVGYSFSGTWVPICAEYLSAPVPICARYPFCAGYPFALGTINADCLYALGTHMQWVPVRMGTPVPAFAGYPFVEYSFVGTHLLLPGYPLSPNTYLRWAPIVLDTHFAVDTHLRVPKCGSHLRVATNGYPFIPGTHLRRVPIFTWYPFAGTHCASTHLCWVPVYTRCPLVLVTH